MPVTPPDLAPLLSAVGGPAALDTTLGDSSVPLALFPVRLETRFVTTATGGSELWVRVYPDKIHIDSHDPRLSADELLWGKQFWISTWQAGADDTALRTAWRQLATRFGPERAAWVATALTPTNPQERPASPGSASAPALPDLGDPAVIPRTALTRLLPTRWVATAYAQSVLVAVVSGQDIAEDLAVGPDLSKARDPLTIADDELAIDDGMRWMVDFDVAQQIGMGLRIPLPSPAVDLLVVTGVRDGDASDALAAQFDAHHYGDGLAFVPPATPTNNTDTTRSGVGATDSEQRRSYDSEWIIKPGTDSAARLASAAFGVAAFDRIAAAADTDQVTTRAMLTTLWPATWGYYLSQMVGFDATFTPAARDWVRGHALTFLRPGGPLPVLRCGTQPYGILPATSLDIWTASPDSADASFANGLCRLLVALRTAFWRPALGSVARVGRTDDVAADLIEVLQTSALSGSWATRRMMGQHFLQHLRTFLGDQLDAAGFWQRLVQLGSAAGQLAQLGFVPSIAHMAYEGATRDVRVPLVGDASYLGDLHSASSGTLEDIVTQAERGAPLLHVLLRHALLRQFGENVSQLLDSPQTPFATVVRDVELVDLVPSPTPTPTWAWQRKRPVNGQAAAAEVAANAGTELAEFRTALAHLLTVDPGDLERHVAATLDAASHRLDAWMTSLATRRLAELRARRQTGVIIGGYGWLENLVPAPDRASAPATPGEVGPLFVDTDDPGFIHAPSLNQASTAALLRNAHLAHGAQPDGPYAIELTSGRVRAAQHLFDGVRQGQPLGALLGYRFERALHEAELDVFIDEFRSLAPLAGAEALRIVVDGLALSQRWQSDPNAVLAALASAGLTSTDARRPTLSSALNQLAGAVDSAADAIAAEGAYQMVRGNLARTSATLDAVSSGQTPPPDLGFLDTPRTGVALTQRVLSLIAGHDLRTASDGWALSTPRADADPALASWVAGLLGPVTDIAVIVEVIAADGSIASSLDVAVSTLGMAAIDLVWAMGGVQGNPPELVSRVLDAADTGPSAPPAASTLHVDSTALSVQLEVAARLHRLLAGARPCDGADLQPPHADPDRGIDLHDYEQRAAAAERALADVRAKIASATDDAARRSSMLSAAAFGVPGAVPTPGAPLAPQASALMKDIDGRLAKVASLQAPADNASGGGGTSGPDGAERDRILQRFRAVFGPSFLALPRFGVPPDAEVAASAADADALLGGDPLAAHTWLTRMERVREPLARLTRVAREIEVLRGTDAFAPVVAQIPHVPNQRWIALPKRDGAAPADGSVSLLLAGAPPQLTGHLSGVVVDEWAEVVPSSTETTAIAFRYSPPDPAPPQAILLAVPPVLGAPWTVRSLNRVLIETLETARLRGVQLAALGAAAHYLPATHLAFNVDGDAVSTDFRETVE